MLFSSSLDRIEKTTNKILEILISEFDVVLLPEEISCIINLTLTAIFMNIQV
jgi:hypothetical protein